MDYGQKYNYGVTSSPSINQKASTRKQSKGLIVSAQCESDCSEVWGCCHLLAQHQWTQAWGLRASGLMAKKLTLALVGPESVPQLTLESPACLRVNSSLMSFLRRLPHLSCCSIKPPPGVVTLVLVASLAEDGPPNRTLGDVQWLGNVFVPKPWFILFNRLFVELPGALFCLHSAIVARSADEPLTGPSDTGVLIWQSIETHSLYSGDLYYTNCEAASAKWPDICWIRSVNLKRGWMLMQSRVVHYSSRDDIIF